MSSPSVPTHTTSSGWVFQTVSLADTIDIDYTPARRSRIQIESSLDIPDNLIVKAADLVLAAMQQRARTLQAP